jgi:hypothetical protein
VRHYDSGVATSDSTHHVPTTFDVKNDVFRRFDETKGEFVDFELEVERPFDEWFTGNGVPDDVNGGEGDQYYDLDSGYIYLKGGGTWTQTGYATPPGSITWRGGAGPPDDSVGDDGDHYFWVAMQRIYKRTAGVYQVVAHIDKPHLDSVDLIDDTMRALTQALSYRSPL